MLLKLERRRGTRQWLILVAGALLVLLATWIGPDLYHAVEDHQFRRAIQAYQ